MNEQKNTAIVTPQVSPKNDSSEITAKSPKKGRYGVLLLIVIAVFVAIIFIMNYRTEKPSSQKNDVGNEDMVTLLDAYKKASLAYTAISYVETKSMPYSDWQSLVNSNILQWKELETMSAGFSSVPHTRGFPNRLKPAYVFAQSGNEPESIQLSGSELIQEGTFNSPLTFSLEQSLPSAIEQSIVNDVKTMSSELQQSLRSYNQTTEQEYKEATLPIEIQKRKKTGPPSISKLIFYSVGDMIPFVSVPSQVEMAAQAELLARSIAFFTGADYALAATENGGTIIFDKLAGSTEENGYLPVDLSKLPSGAKLYTVQRGQQAGNESIVSSIQNLKQMYDAVSAKTDLTISTSGIGLTIDLANPESPTASLLSVQKDELENQLNLQNIAKANFPAGDYRIEGISVSIPQEEPTLTNTTESKSYAGVYTAKFKYTVPVSGGSEDITVTITINEDDSVSCSLSATLPYHEYKMAGSPVKMGVSGTANGSLTGTVVLKTMQVSCSGKVTAVSKATVSGQVQQVSSSGTGQISGNITEDGKISATLSSKDVQNIGEIDFTATKTDTR